ncbi:ubiquitin-related modifier 1 [Chelonus insularis]|uniref:ubiquitin-related modifier 1 n=1 Tax=Chelonus insularis TaxID=460826 RepID=UPI001588C4B0|nr:ubiquitin-related modifier 1 [Chelonus insularis]XP_034937890.1 ubiquitin-related modifier 1 [Chelonus insularis]
MSVEQKGLTVTVHFGGGAENLFGKKKDHKVCLPDAQNEWTLEKLIFWIRDNLLTEREELFLQNNTVRPGILVVVNETDWELLGNEKYKLCPDDQIYFISTLHGG